MRSAVVVSGKVQASTPALRTPLSQVVYWSRMMSQCQCRWLALKLVGKWLLTRKEGGGEDGMVLSAMCPSCVMAETTSNAISSFKLALPSRHRVFSSTMPMSIKGIAKGELRAMTNPICSSLTHPTNAYYRSEAES